MRLLWNLTDRWAWLPVAAAIGLCAFGAYVDAWLGEKISISVLYFPGIALICWRMGLGAGVLFSIGCAVATGVGFDSGGFWSVVSAATSNSVFCVLVWALQKSRRRARELERIDPLTELSNSRAFIEHVDAARQQPLGGLTIAFLDCDDFKNVNDQRGHLAGDALLKHIGETLRDSSPEGAFVARMGGDEFAVLLPTTGDDAESALETLRTTLTDETQRQHCAVTMSIGAATFAETSLSAEEMIHRADEAMYAAKQDGKDRIHWELDPSPNPPS